jgi:integrase
MSIREILKKNKPSISDTSLKTYISILNGIYRKMGNNGEADVKYFIDNQDEIIEFLKEIPYHTRKTKLASLVSLCSHNSKCADKYRKIMIDDINKYNEELKTQELTDKERKNWITQEEVKKVYNELYKDANHLFNKEKLTKNEMMRLQNLVTLSLYTMIAPRRILDYTKFKLRNYNENEDNYMNKKVFVFNNYKTDKSHGKQSIPIPIKLYNIVKKWEKKHDNDYLLYSDNGKPLQPSQLTLRLNKMFGKNVSVNSLRHSYITEDVLKAMPAIKKLEETAEAMGHTIDQQLLYKKIGIGKND